MFRATILGMLVSVACPSLSMAIQPAVGNSDAGRATGRLASDWRYVYFHGRHWYWMPNASWKVWTDDGWVTPESSEAATAQQYSRFNYSPSDAGSFLTFAPMNSNFGAGGDGAGPTMANEHFLSR
jgi:hypothetical protein